MAEAGSCETCRYWKEPDEYDGYTGPDYGICTISRSKKGQPVHSKCLAVAKDYEGYEAYLATKAQFGCIQWKRR